MDFEEAGMEERIVRLAALSSQPEVIPVQPDNPLSVVRAACAKMVHRLAPDHYPTLVLIEANDLAGGLLEALFGSQRQNTSAAITVLANGIRALADEEPLMLAVCMSQPSLEAWERPEWPGSVHIKENEFLVRLAENYRLTIVIGGVEADRTDVPKLIARLHRALDAVSGEKCASDWNNRLKQVRDDVAALYRRADAILGKDLIKFHFPSSTDSHSRFLQILGRLDQFGKRPVENIRSGISRDPVNKDALEPYRDGSYGLRRALKQAVQQGDKEQYALFSHLQAYDFFRDCARWLGDGVFPWAREWRRPRQQRNGNRSPTSQQQDVHSDVRPEPPEAPFRALFIDENLGPPKADDDSETSRLRERISEIFSPLFGERFELHAIYDANGVLPNPAEHSAIGDSIVEIDRFFEYMLPERTYRVDNWRQGEDVDPQWKFSRPSEKRSLRDYEVIFCEIDYRSRFGGPQVVQKLASYLERTAPRDGRSAVPALIVLTHMDNIGHVQQCLNLGAHSFVNKERLYQIPSRLKRAVEDVQAVGASGGVMPREPSGQHSNFRTLYSLRPDRTAHLRNQNFKQFVVGGWMPRERAQARAAREGSGASRDIPDWDGQDRDWIRRLPKADLHCHFGTSIGLETIEALAFNTCGHLFVNWAGVAKDRELLAAPVRVLLDDVCKIVLDAAAARQSTGCTRHPAVDYFRAMERTLGRKPAERIPDDPYGEIVKALMDKRPPIKDHMIVALLIAVTARLRDGRNSGIDPVQQPWSYFTELSRWCESEETAGAVAQRDGRHSWIHDFVIPAACSGAAAALVLRKSIGPLPIDDKSIFERIQKPDPDPGSCAEFWTTWHGNIGRRLNATAKVIDDFLQEASADAPESSGMRDLFKESGCACVPTLSELVVLPVNPSREDHRLLRYLWGCGLLGAEHLQYPENIILAAHDLVRQNVDDNVVYTEVRCETPGYTRAGLSAETVTDLLCVSFDLAEAFERKFQRRSFVRTNILLAAKRHKKDQEIERVISLLAGYLSRRSAPRPLQDKTEVPAWWQRTRVVGFDLSGDESKNSDGLKRQINRLIELSSPITIHAGEAASAESIWQAVYEYHARRIGHGLRLRERGQLLQFCINEGICMELCPISNCFTSDFVQINREDRNSEKYKYDKHRIEHYPLRHFMETGLEVCVNTDNRSLHGRYGDSLTDEYLWAARLSGGFTRWEVLRLIKAGFKHAFIDKSDAQELIQAVENWMFAQVANAPGLDWHPAQSPDGVRIVSTDHDPPGAPGNPSA
jgi:adenosine deaminase